MISASIGNALNDLENRYWRELCRPDPDVLRFLEPEAVIILFDGTILDGKSGPSKSKYFGAKSFQPWTSFELRNVKIFEIDLMAAVIYYEISAGRREEQGMQTYRLQCSSTWKQLANEEWKMCFQQQTEV